MRVTPERLEQVVQAETALFCQVEQQFQQENGANNRGFRDESFHVRTLKCNVATSFLQQRLREQHAIDTHRLYGEPPRAPHLESGYRIFGHLILQYDTLLIDPTYGQLFSFVGLSPRHPETTPDHFPKPLALMVDTKHPDVVLGPLIAALHAAEALPQAQQSRYAPLRGLGQQAIGAVVHDIYTVGRYAPQEASPSDVSHDHVQALLRRAQTYER